MSTSAAIVVQDERVFGRFQAHRPVDHVVHAVRTDSIQAICDNIARARFTAPRDQVTRLTIFCHGDSHRHGFGLVLGTGLSNANLQEARTLAIFGFRKIVIKACGAVAPQAAGGAQRIGHDPATEDSLAAQHDFYGRLARICDTEIIAAEQWQLTRMNATGVMNALPWIGVRWAYTPAGERRGIVPRPE